MNKLKIINASRGFIHQYEDIERKLLSCNADIYFNQQCYSCVTTVFLHTCIDNYTFSTAGMNKLKIINASRGFIHQYKNIKRKLRSCNADIYFNQQCTAVLRRFSYICVLTIISKVYIKHSWIIKYFKICA